MTKLKEKIDYYKDLAFSIEKKINENSIEESRLLLKRYSGEIQNSDKFCFTAILEYQKGDIASAINELNEGVTLHPFNYNIYYNLGFIYNSIDELELALDCFYRAAKYSLSEEDKKNAINNALLIIDESKKKKHMIYSTLENKKKEMELFLKQSDARGYPINENMDSIIREIQLEDTQEEYMINMYQSMNINNVDSISRLFFKSELIKGQGISHKLINSVGPIIIPISQINHKPIINIKVNGKKYDFSEYSFTENQFHYIRIDEPGKIEIKSDRKIFIGAPIEMNPIKKPVKLFLKIFIDGLSYQFLEDNGFEKVMANTYQFFNNSFISRNSYTTSEWTLPSKASINTGVYATKHRLLHPNHLYTFSDSQKMLAEYFQEKNYYCTNIGTNWRTTPSLGYHRGYNRMIYQSYMDSKEVIMETIEHLLSFENTNNFISISLMDLHNVADGFDSHLYSQINTNITNKINKNKIGSTSVQTKYDVTKIEKYLQEIKRLDKILGILYDFVTKNYSEDEFVLTLHSDHGQSFLDNNFNLLSDNRLKVPFMMRGKNVPSAQSDELIETVDILPAILDCCELNKPKDIDGQLPKVFGGEIENKYTLTQIIHPNQTYKALINEKGLSYYLETKHNVLDDLTICLEDYKSYIVDKKSGVDVTEQHIDKLNQYDEVVFSNIKNMLRWSN